MEMKLIGTRFTKIHAERNPDFTGQVKTTTNIKINDISEVKEPKNSIKISYLFEIDYSDLGKISLEGLLYLSMDQKTFKELLRTWKEKKVDSEEYIIISNLVLQKASIKALELEDDFGLPIHIQMPQLAKTKE
jgi:hypothetical protein